MKLKPYHKTYTFNTQTVLEILNKKYKVGITYKHIYNYYPELKNELVRILDGLISIGRIPLDSNVFSDIWPNIKYKTINGFALGLSEKKKAKYKKIMSRNVSPSAKAWKVRYKKTAAKGYLTSGEVLELNDEISIIIDNYGI